MKEPYYIEWELYIQIFKKPCQPGHPKQKEAIFQGIPVIIFQEDRSLHLL